MFISFLFDLTGRFFGQRRRLYLTPSCWEVTDAISLEINDFASIWLPLILL